MRADHQKVFVADLGRTSFGAAAMDGAMLPNHIVVPDLDLCFSFRRKRQILRCRADNGAMSDKVTGPDRNAAFDHDVRLNDRIFAEHCLRTNYRVRSDLDIVSNLRTGIDDCGRMDFQRTPASLKLK